MSHYAGKAVDATTGYHNSKATYGDLNKGTGCGANGTTDCSLGTSPSGLADGLSDSLAHTGIDSSVTGIVHGSRAARQPPAPQQREDTCSTSPCSATGTWGTSLRRAPGKTHDGARARAPRICLQ